MTRYDAQLRLPAVGSAGQQRLQHARILVVGAGGLGAALLPLLAGAGVGKLRICDADRVELGNLQRQPLYRMDDVGRLKVAVARQTLAALNPEVAIETIPERLTPGNVGRLLVGIDLAIDAADSVAATYILSDACVRLKLPLISASAIGLRGYVGGFCGNAPSYRALFPDAPAATGGCDALGVLGPVVATMGTIAAQMALSVLLRLSPSPLGSLFHIDFGNWHSGGMRFDAAREPPQFAPFITLASLADRDCVVDLRDTQEAPESVRDDALRVLPDQIEAWQPPAGRRLVMTCATGLRAMRAANQLLARGYPAVAVLAANDGLSRS